MNGHMKQLIFGAGCVLFLVQESTSASSFSIGGRVGFNLANVSLEEENEFQTSAGGIYAGVFADCVLAPFFSIVPEIAYSMKGVQWVYDRENTNGDMISETDASRVSYLEIPLHLVFSLPKKKWLIRPYLYGGPSVAFFLGAQKQVTLDGTQIYSGPKNESARNVDFGIGFGGGGIIALGPGDIRIDVRYTMGLLTVDAGADEDVKNSVFTFSAGYSVPLCKAKN